MRINIPIFMTLVLLLSPALVQAVEKQLDSREFLPGPASLFPVSGTLTPGSPTYDRVYAYEATGECSIPAFDSFNDGMHFEIICIQVEDTMPIELVLDPAGTNIEDTVLTIYCPPFDLGHPELNVVGYDDDSGEGTLSAITPEHGVTLEPGVDYLIILSTFGAGMTGDFLLRSSENVYDCGVVAEEASSWGTLKSLYR